MILDKIYEPILEDLTGVKDELNKLAYDFASSYNKKVFNHFFNLPGKFLRPALAVLSAKALNRNLSEDQISKLIKLSTAFELIHSASLVHDDIIDLDLLRRGQKTLNNVYGNKIAVLSGDILYIRAFAIFVEVFPKGFAEFMLEVTEKMCAAEVVQAGFEGESPTKDSYLKTIVGKTGLLMSAACRLGAELATEKKEDINALEKFGLNFGMRYQVIDDLKDNDPIAIKHVCSEDVKQFGIIAKDAIAHLEGSVFKKSLIDLVDFNFN